MPASITGMPGYRELLARLEGGRPELEDSCDVEPTSPLEGKRRLLELLAEPRGPRGGLE